MAIKYDRLILLMDGIELEQFCLQWVRRRAGYIEVCRLGGPGDKGRDVVGFVSDQRYDGPWDNYQCKQYRAHLGLSEGLLAVGKVLYWASTGEFSVPRRFYFVAPKGLNKNLDALVGKPSAFKQTLIDQWDAVCAKNISKGQNFPLDAKLEAIIHAFPFNEIHKITVDEILADQAVVPLLVEQYGADPGHYAPGVVPPDIEAGELKYLRALVDAYGERENSEFSDHAAVLLHKVHGPDLKDHRERYFEADAFQKFYRDNTSPQVIEAFRKDIRFGIKDTLSAPATDTLARIQAAMTQAATVQPAGALHKYAYVAVKQGVCHHLVSDEEISWKLP